MGGLAWPGFDAGSVEVKVKGRFVLPCRRAFRVNVFKVNVFKVKGHFVLPCRRAFRVNVFKVKGHFVLPEGSPSRGGMRPAPAPRLSGKHNRPLKRVPSSLHISSRTGRDSLPAQRSLVPPSMAGHPEMFTSSAVVMPPQGQNPGQNPSQNPNI